MGDLIDGDLELNWEADPRPILEYTDYPSLSDDGPKPVLTEIPTKNPDYVFAAVMVVTVIALAVLGWLAWEWTGEAVGAPGPRIELSLEPVTEVPVKFVLAETEQDLSAVTRKKAPLPKPKPRVAASVSRATTSGGWSSARASWYGPGLYGGKTADGSAYTPSTWCVAHKSLPFGTMVEIVYNGKTVTVPVKDRGPFTPGREFDLSGAVAQALGFGGVQTIQYRIVR